MTEDIVSQPTITEMRNTPQILISKMSMLNNKCQDCFYGEITLCDKIKYACQIKEEIIRISKDRKIKYFIELRKIKCNYELIDPKKINLAAKTKNY